MKKGIIITSFGTTYEETRKKNIEPIEKLARERFDQCEVQRAFTSRMVIRKLKNRDGYHVDTPTEAMEKLRDKGIEEIYIQPLLIIEGHEYDKVKKEVEEFISLNPQVKVVVGKPLLNSDEDYSKVVEALEIKDYQSGSGLVFMGHGSDHNADLSYEKLEDFIKANGHTNIFMGTVEGSTMIEDILPKLKANGISKVDLLPFMLVAGDHAVNDMASDEDDSWNRILVEEGFQANPIIRGLGELEGIRRIFISHLEDLM